MSIEYIQKALDIALKQFGIDNNIDVELEDYDGKTDTSKAYLSSTQVNTIATVADLGTTDIREGFYQVNVNYKSGQGSAKMNRMLDLINNTFKSGATFTFNGVCVQVLDAPPSQLVVNGGWATHPLTINWSSYTARL